MKRKLATICIFLITALTLTATFDAAQASISAVYYSGSIFRGYESRLYRKNIVAFKEGTNARIIVSVYNHMSVDIEVYNVTVWFDWDQTFSSTECSVADPYTIEPGLTHVFTISVDVPDTSVASNLWAHSWKIFVDFNYDTSKGTWIVTPSDAFVVFSAEQADAWKLAEELDIKLDSAPSFSSEEAEFLEDKAELEYDLGYDYYWSSWDFANAKTHFQNGISYIDQACEIEASYVKVEDENDHASQEAEIRAFNAEANATLKMADAAVTEANAAMTEANAAMIEANATQTMADAALIQADAMLNQSYAYLLFGVAAVIFAIGVVVYAARKPKIVTA